MSLTRNDIYDLYRRRAANYDFTANLYYLIGFRETKYRKMAISALGLKPGDTVVEIGCGTGLNFQYLIDSIGGTGQLIGVDLTDAMLVKARARIEKNGWNNVQLVQCDAAEYTFPPDINGIISTFALTLVPEYEVIIERACNALVPGGRLVILDLKKADRYPLWVSKLGVSITKPFGVTLDMTERKPWEAMKRYFPEVTISELYGGFAYLAVGEKQKGNPVVS